MKIEQIRTIAKSLGVHPGKLSKLELIKSIQRTEGNSDCFSSATNNECSQMNCLWREGCLTARA